MMKKRYYAYVKEDVNRYFKKYLHEREDKIEVLRVMSATSENGESLLGSARTLLFREKYKAYYEEKTYYANFEEIQRGRTTASLGRDLRILFLYFI